MALALRNAAPLKPEARLGQALVEFESVLTDDQKETLQSYRGYLPSTTAAMILTAEIDRENSKRRIRCVGPRLTSVLESIQQFSYIVETFISGSQSQIAGAIWGSVKLALHAATNLSSYFEKLSILFMDIGRTCPRYNDFASLFPSSLRLQRTLCDYYAVLLRLCRQAIVSSRRTPLSQLSSSLTKSFETDFGPFRKDLETLGLAVREEVLLASEHAYSQESYLQAKERNEGQSYRKVGSLFRNKKEKEIEEAQRRRNRKNKLEFLNSLSIHDHRIAWKQARKQGTSTWLFEDSEFQGWLSAPLSSVIWCSGKLGSGKTVLSANVVEHLMIKSSPHQAVAFFFFRFDQALSAADILGCLARQLLGSLPKWSTAGNDSAEISPYDGHQHIKELLKSELPTNGSYFIVLDGLDDCEKDEASMLMKSMRDLISLPNHVIKLYCSSRPDIVQWSSAGFQRVFRVSMSNTKVDTEIDRYIQMSLTKRLEDEDLVLGDPELIIIIQEALLQGAQGMFLWVAYLIDDICEQKTDSGILNALQDLPRSLSEVLNRVLYRLQRLDSTAAGNGQKIYQWVAAARRPLTLDELREVIGVETCQRDWEVTRLVNSMRQALTSCGSLLIIDEEQSTIHFAHHCIKHHLLSMSSRSDVGGYHVDLKKADRMIGEICVTYINFRIFDRQIGKATRPGLDDLNYPSAILAKTLAPNSIVTQLVKKFIEGRTNATASSHRALMETARNVQSRIHKKGQQDFVFLSYAREFWLSHTTTIMEEKKDIWKLWRNLVDGTNNRVELPWTARISSGNNFPLLDWILQHDHFSLLRLVLNDPSLVPGSHSDRAMYKYTAIQIVRSHNWLQFSCLLSCKIPQSLRDELMIPLAALGRVDLLESNFHQNGQLAVSVSTVTLKEYKLEFPLQGHSGDWTALMVATVCGSTAVINFILSVGYSPQNSCLGQRETDMLVELKSNCEKASLDLTSLREKALYTKIQLALSRLGRVGT